MKNLKEYNIKFSGLKLGTHSFEFQLDDKFFEHFEYSEFTRPRIKADVDLIKKENGLEVKAVVKGVVEILCDISGEPFDLPIEGDFSLLVKFGEEYNDSNEEILILPHGEYQLYVGQYLYETTALAIPLKRVSPEVQNGEKGKEVLNKLEDLKGGEDESTDPRWDKLKDLLN